MPNSKFVGFTQTFCKISLEINSVLSAIFINLINKQVKTDHYRDYLIFKKQKFKIKENEI